MSTVQLRDALQSKYAARLSQRKTDTAVASIEIKLATNNTSIELPEEIDNLIDNKAYRNKFKKLIREGHLNDLMELAKMAVTRDKPKYWFARVTRTKPLPGYENEPTYWERSLKYLAKLRQIRQKAAYTAQKLGTNVTKFIYKQIWKGVNTIRWACLAAETPHNKPNQSDMQHFMWLCKHGAELYATN